MPYKDHEIRKLYYRNRDRDLTAKDREIVFGMFGSKCAKCGFTGNVYAFQLDHIEPLLRLDGRKGTRTWREVARGRTPLDGLQMLCANCHAIKTHEERIKFKHWVVDSPPIQGGETIDNGL